MEISIFIIYKIIELIKKPAANTWYKAWLGLCAPTSYHHRSA